MDVLLGEDLRVEVADLRPHHGQRVARSRMAGSHEEGVRIGVREAEQPAAARPPAACLCRGPRGPARGHGRDVGDCRAGRTRDDRLEDDAPGVGECRAAPSRMGGRLLVREGPAGDGRRCLGVVALAPVVPEGRARGFAEAVAEADKDLGPRELVAAPLAENPADQGGRRQEVCELPRIRAERTVDRRVLGRHQREVELGLVDVQVDPGDVARRVVDDLLAVGAVALREEVDLPLELGLGVRGVDERALVHRPVARRPAGEPGELAAAGVAEGVHLEEPVLRRGEPRRELGSRPGGTVDVGNPEVRVPDDHPVVARPLDRPDVAGRDAEARVLEVLGDVLRRETRRLVEEARVHRVLVEAVGRPGPVELEEREAEHVRQAVLPRREDVVEAAVPVVVASGRAAARPPRTATGESSEAEAREGCEDGDGGRAVWTRPAVGRPSVQPGRSTWSGWTDVSDRTSITTDGLLGSRPSLSQPNTPARPARLADSRRSSSAG